MNLFNALKNTVIALILFAIISGEALAENPSVFESYNLRYGITVNLPRHWRILEKQLIPLSFHLKNATRTQSVRWYLNDMWKLLHISKL